MKESFDRHVSDLYAWVEMSDEEKEAADSLAEKMYDDWRGLTEMEAEAARRISEIFKAWQTLTANQRLLALRSLCKSVHFSYAPRSVAELVKITAKEETK